MGEGLFGRVRYCVCAENGEKKDKREGRKERKAEMPSRINTILIKLFVYSRVCRGDREESQLSKGGMWKCVMQKNPRPDLFKQTSIFIRRL